MKIETLKEMEEIIRMARKNGVKTLEVDGIKLELGDMPPHGNSKKFVDQGKIPFTPQYTPEEIMFYSSTPLNMTEINKDAVSG